MHQPGADRAGVGADLGKYSVRILDLPVSVEHDVAELGETADCRSEATELRQRLSRVVDIERRLNQGHPK